MKKLKLVFVAIWWFMFSKEEDVRPDSIAEPKNYHQTIYLSNTRGNRRFAARRQDKGRFKGILYLIMDLFEIRIDKKGHAFLLMTLPSTGQVITARIAFPKDHGGIVERSRTIKTSCDGNTWVTFTTLEIGALGTLINTYEDAHGAARDVAYDELNNMLKNIFLLRVQQAANSDLAHAIVIIQACGLHVQGVGGQHEQIFDCYHGIQSGSVGLVAPSGPAYSCHCWYYSKDGINFTPLEPTMAGNDLITGLEVGKMAYFKHQGFDKNGGMGLSQKIEIMVN